MRWVISPIVGTGTAGDPFRAKVSDLGPGHASLIPSDEFGEPVFGWAFCRLAETLAAAADADPDNIVFPDLAPAHVLTAGERNWLITKLGNRGLPSGWVNPGITVRDVVRTIIRWLDSRADESWLAILE